MIKPILEEKERKMKALLLTCLEKFSIHVNEKRTGGGNLVLMSCQRDNCCLLVLGLVDT